VKILSALCVSLAVIGLLFAPVAWAGETDPSGMKLKSVVEEYLETAPAADAKAKTIRDAGGVDSLDSMGANGGGVEALCTMQMVSLVGYAIWENREHLDNCHSTGGMSPFQYCVMYTKRAEPFKWNPLEMEKQGCPKPWTK
jgi:hypothetical protein